MNHEEKLKSEEARQKFSLAQQYLKESRKALRAGSVRLATDGAYNAAETIMKAMILLEDESVPKRHGSIAQKFSLLFVKSGTLNNRIGSEIKDAFKFRNKARYDENVEITREHARHNLDLAKTLIEYLGKELKKLNTP